MRDLATLFPLAVLVLMVVVAILAVRLSTRLSRSAGSAGALEVDRPEPAGLAPIPWEVETIERQLNLVAIRSDSPPRYELTATVNRLLKAAGLSSNGLPYAASEAELELAVSMIEDHLDLPPLTTGNDPL